MNRRPSKHTDKAGRHGILSMHTGIRIGLGQGIGD